jgi:hypothetical protein
MIRAGLSYAGLGWRVLPVEPGGKRPLLERWPERATTNPDQLKRWFGRSPDANLAIATGPKSGIFVLDIDGPEGERSLVELERRHSPLPELYPMQWTGGGRGGWQAFFRYPEGREIGNSAGRLGPKLDTRGTGGYCLLPPSVTAEAYQWVPDRDPWTLPPEPAPAWLANLLDPPAPPEPEYRAFSPVGNLEAGERYLQRALEAELALIASAPNGRRNDQLNESAHALFRFVCEGRLVANALIPELKAAARAAGLTDSEIASTIGSAAKARGLSL